jgi:hypothetical protein
MALDSISALILFAAAVGAWRIALGARAQARIHLRFAAILFAALGAAEGLGLVANGFAALAPAVAPVALSLGSIAISLSLFSLLSRPVPIAAASLGLMLALGFGLASALAGTPAYALVCQIAALALCAAVAFTILPFDAPRGLLSLLASLSLLCGGLMVMAGALSAASLFFAAGLVAAARVSQLGIEYQRDGRLRAAIAGR